MTVLYHILNKSQGKIIADYVDLEDYFTAENAEDAEVKK
jgi:hypothetical protein